MFDRILTRILFLSYFVLRVNTDVNDIELLL